MRLLDSDLFEIIDACLDGRLAGTTIAGGRDTPRASSSPPVDPGPYRSSLPISGLEAAGGLEDVVIFHAGTAYDDGRYITDYVPRRAMSVALTVSNSRHIKAGVLGGVWVAVVTATELDVSGPDVDHGSKQTIELEARDRAGQVVNRQTRLVRG